MFKEDKDLKKGIILILVAGITYLVVNNIETVGAILGKALNIIFPFVLGACLAFLINIPMSYFERKIKKIKNKDGKIMVKNKPLLRVISLVASFLIVAFIIFLIINLIVPELVNIVKMLINNVPYYVEEINKMLKDTELLSEINVNTESLKDEITNAVPNLVSSSITIITGIIGTISNLVIGIIFAIYILLSKEKLIYQTKKLMFTYMKREVANKVIRIARVSSETFKNFFTVQCLEATILGTLCVLGMLILNIPYAIPIGVLVGVTALIPIVGAFIGVIIGAILIVSVDPIKVITFIVFFLILQQIEGNVIYPKVVGTSVGLPGMWVLFAVTIGGSLGGIVGMLIGVPIASVIYSIIKDDVKNKSENVIVS
jgi:predicted PurR-regulated permease PerM